MLTNTDATLYRRSYDADIRLDRWERIYLPAVWWFENEQSAVTTNARKTADICTVRIPLKLTENPITVRKDDYLVKGDCEIEMQTAKDLVQKEHFKVSAANLNAFGSNPHIKVTGGV